MTKPTNKTEIATKDNDNIELSENDVAEVAEAILQTKNVNPKDQKQTRFFLLWFMGVSPTVAATMAGYCKDYGYRLVQKYRKNTKLRAHVEQIANIFPDRYRSVCKLRLAEMAEIEAKALQAYKDDPLLAISKPALLKQIKQGAGILSDDVPGPSPQISIASVKNLMLQIHESKGAQ